MHSLWGKCVDYLHFVCLIRPHFFSHFVPLFNPSSPSTNSSPPFPPSLCSDKGSWLKVRLHFTGAATPMVAECQESELDSSQDCSFHDSPLTPSASAYSFFSTTAAAAPPQRRLLQPVASNAPLLFAFLALLSVLGAFGGYLIPAFYSAYMTRTTAAGISKLYPAVSGGGMDARFILVVVE